ncbi:MAG TPA: prenyltransferase/squalene oxidase repeat-containing protein, partial [Planctomycetaceae bacterium]|nr:prenyltransferase/squalene oxidase repeat-containing protein [Planctomycetaceae bacterium]
MSSGLPESHGSRFPISSLPESAFDSKDSDVPIVGSNPALDKAISKTQKHLIDRQHEDGFWVAELEGDTILESEYMLLLGWLKKEQDPVFRQCANYILDQQMPEGGWTLYPGGPLEISSSVKAYFALKIAGHDPESEPMQRAQRAILDAGGAEKVNSFTRYYLALLGIIGYHQVPAVPPELMLLPRWMPFNIYEMSAWSRTIIVPLSLLWHFKPVRKLPDEWRIDELFHTSPRDLPVSMPPSAVVDELKQSTRIDWYKFFRRVDSCLKFGDRVGLRPFRKTAVKRAAKWMIERLDHSDGLGAIFPPIIWSVVALRELGYSQDSPEVQTQLNELEKLMITEGDRTRLQPCKSPVWDTSIATIALRESGISWNHPAILKSCEWMLSKEVRSKGDWSVRSPDLAPGGWYFEFHNEFYPDVDDSIMVTMALNRSLPRKLGTDLNINWLEAGWSPHAEDQDAVAVVTGKAIDNLEAIEDLELAANYLPAMKRAIDWVLRMQNSDGGWGAFDRDNTRELFTKVPFADHNAMIDPSWPDISARVLEMLADVGWDRRQPAIDKALDYIWNEQEHDHCWFGRWGVNYIYGTWQVLVGLTKIGVRVDDPRVVRGAQWLIDHQQENGGWGETARSYDDPSLRGQGPATASQTAWALLGLIAAGRANDEAVHKGVQYLIDSQNDDGSWTEKWFTGTGFPKVFYLKYH